MEGHRCTWISVEMVLFVLSTLAFEGKYVYGIARECDEFLDGKFLLLHHSGVCVPPSLSAFQFEII